jgi:serine/threonine-protein kinase
MSPEQMRSAKYVDARTDVWSLGVTLFELLCGKTPFRGDSMTELVAAVLQAEPLALRDVRADLPPELTPVLGRALEKDPARRYRTVGELASALAAFGPSHSELTVERIARALSSMAPGASGAPSAPPVHGSRLRPEAEQLAHEATAEAVSVPVVRGAGSTTAQPVSNEGGRVATPPARSRGSAFWIVVAGVVVAAGGAAAMKLRGNGPGPGVVAEPSASPSTAPPSPPSAPPSAAASVEGRPSTPVAPVESPAPAASAQVPRKATAPAHPAAVNVAPPRPAAAAAQPAPASSPACRVVQYLDADGETRFRRECP